MSLFRLLRIKAVSGIPQNLLNLLRKNLSPSPYKRFGNREHLPLPSESATATPQSNSSALPSGSFVKSVAVLILALGLLGGCQSSSDINQETLNVLQQVEEQYRSLESFRLGARITTDLDGGGRKQTIDIPLTYAVSRPDNMRLEVRHERAPITMVSDGSVTWTYNPSSDQYSRTEASVLQNDSGSEGGLNATDRQFFELAQSLTQPYATITDQLKSARILKSETLLFQNDSVDTFLIEATYKDENQQMPSEASVSPTRYWVSKDQHLVLKQLDSYMLPAKKSEDSVQVTETTVVHSFEQNPSFSSSTFNFETPDDAERVSEVSLGGRSGSSMEGREAPSFTLTNLAGKEVSLQDYRGNIVMLDFWATWCAPCRRAHPDIQDLYEEYKEDGVVILGINNEGRNTARQYMQKHDYNFPTLLDTTDSTAREYGVNAMPYYFVIDRNGNISSEIVGYHPKSDMLEALKKAGLKTE